MRKSCLCQFRETAQLHDVDTIGGDFRPSAHRERAKAKLSLIEEVREETLRIPPPDFAPRWGQSGDSRRLVWIHRKNKNSHKLAGCQAWKSPTKQRKDAKW